MQKTNGELVYIVTTVLVVLLVVTMITLFIVFSRRKDRLLLERREEKKRYEREIAESQIEIREETLRNISWELHDNIGQLLTLAKIQLQNATPETYSSISETIGKSLNEVRALSKLINPEFINNIKLKEALTLEVERFNRLNYIDASLVVQGEEKTLNQKHGIVIFRMLQEFFSNTIKHSKASKLEVFLNYEEDKLSITAKDNGIGFNFQKVAYKGIGLENIKKRGELIGANVSISSTTNSNDSGTSIKIIYYFNEI